MLNICSFGDFNFSCIWYQTKLGEQCFTVFLSSSSQAAALSLSALHHELYSVLSISSSKGDTRELHPVREGQNHPHPEKTPRVFTLNYSIIHKEPFTILHKIGWILFQWHLKWSFYLFIVFFFLNKKNFNVVLVLMLKSFNINTDCISGKLCDTWRHTAAGRWDNQYHWSFCHPAAGGELWHIFVHALCDIVMYCVYSSCPPLLDRSLTCWELELSATSARPRWAALSMSSCEFKASEAVKWTLLTNLLTSLFVSGPGSPMLAWWFCCVCSGSVRCRERMWSWPCV